MKFLIQILLIVSLTGFFVGCSTSGLRRPASDNIPLCGDRFTNPVIMSSIYKQPYENLSFVVAVSNESLNPVDKSLVYEGRTVYGVELKIGDSVKEYLSLGEKSLRGNKHFLDTVLISNFSQSTFNDNEIFVRAVDNCGARGRWEKVNKDRTLKSGAFFMERESN